MEEKNPAEYELKTLNNGEMVESEPAPAVRNRRIVIYRKRWFILALSCLIQFIDQIIFLSYAPVANYADSFYGEYAVNTYAIICTACSIPASAIAPWFGSRFSLRIIMLYPAWVNTFGVILRMLSHIPVDNDLLPIHIRYALTAAGQGLAATGTPFAVYQPSKVGGAWFPISERALATSVGAISGMFGILFVNIVCPQLVHSTGDIFKLNLMVLCLTVATAVLTTVGVWRTAEPLDPPSESASADPYPFWMGLKKVLKLKSFLVLLVVMGGGSGCFTCLYTLMEQILCAKGYSNQFAGLCIALLIGVGLVGGIVGGLVVSKWQNFEEVLKISACMCALTSVAFALLAMRPNMEIYLAMVASVFGSFAMAFYGVGLDAGAEITYPVAETTSSGLMVLSGMIQFIIYLGIMQVLQKPLSAADKKLEKCSVLAKTGIEIEAHDMTNPLLVLSTLMAFHGILLTIFFKPTYERLQKERTQASLAAAAAATSKGAEQVQNCINQGSTVKT